MATRTRRDQVGPIDVMLASHTASRFGRLSITCAGFWGRLDRETPMLDGCDAGVYDPPPGFMYTVISNTSAGAWSLVELLDDQLPDLVRS